MTIKSIGSMTIALGLCFLLTGCAAAPKAAQMTTSIGCELVGFGVCNATADTQLKGVAYNSPYSIEKRIDGRYILTSPSQESPIDLGYMGPISPVSSLRTSNQETTDFYLVPEGSCPFKYLIIQGRERRITNQVFGCDREFAFELSADRRYVFATERIFQDGTQPFAYRMNGDSFSNGQPISEFREHPAYNLFVAPKKNRTVIEATRPGRPPTDPIMIKPSNPNTADRSSSDTKSEGLGAVRLPPRRPPPPLPPPPPPTKEDIDKVVVDLLK